MRTPRPILFFLFPLAAVSYLLTRPTTVLHAQSSASSPAEAKTPQYVTYQSGSAQWLSAPHSLELSQGVEFGQDDATLKTQAAVALLDKDQNLVSAKADGPVHLYDTQDDLVGQHGSVDFTKHLATLRDGITLVVKPGKRETSAAGTSPRKQFKDPATLTCQEMTYDYKFKIGRIPGQLTVTQVVQTKDGQQTRILTADAGLYNGKAQTIQLVGDIKGTYSDGSVIQGDTRLGKKPVLINIKEGSEAIFVPFKTIGHFTVKPGSDDDKDTPDDEPDLSLPVTPPHTPSSSDSPTSIRPAAVQAPLISGKPAPAGPPVQAQAPAATTQIPAAAAAGSP